MSAITAAVSRDGPLGPDRAGTSAAGPDPVNALPQRRRVSGSTPNPAATCTALAALIRTRCTAAKRRHTRPRPAHHGGKPAPRARLPPRLQRSRSGPRRRAGPGTGAAGPSSPLSFPPPHSSLNTVMIISHKVCDDKPPDNEFAGQRPDTAPKSAAMSGALGPVAEDGGVHDVAAPQGGPGQGLVVGRAGLGQSGDRSPVRRRLGRGAAVAGPLRTEGCRWGRGDREGTRSQIRPVGGDGGRDRARHLPRGP